VAVDRFIRKATTILPPLNPCPAARMEDRKSQRKARQPAQPEIKPDPVVKPDPEIKQEPFTIRGCFGIHDSYTDR
jgi:hypothetical protein